MEAYYAFVKKIIAAFNETDLDYAFTGALAISFYGVPRTTSDVDVIVAVAKKTEVKTKLVGTLRKAGVLVDERKIDNALTSGFKIASFRDTTSPFCVDIIFTSEKLQKRVGNVVGLDTFLQSPEGLIAAKLRMIKATLPPERSAKDKKDIQAMLKFTKVDLGAVKKLAKEDGTLNVFDALGLNA